MSSAGIAGAPLAVSGVCKAYADKQVLADITLRLEQGEIFGLIGLNGAGKTTLIKIILDLVECDAGEISLFGVDRREVRARTRLSYLPEKFQPSRYLKGLEYLSLSLSYYGRKLDVAQAQAMAERLDLDPAVLPSRVSTYSKGMGQKLGLAGAFLIDAPLIMLDEPMSGLDPRARIRLKAVMQTAREAGKTIFFSSHILSDLDEICDRIGVIHEGNITFLGAPAAFKAKLNESSLEKAFLRSIDDAPRLKIG